jgi:hypothetical protein
MGTDRLRGIERLDFADGSAPLALGDTLTTDEDAGRGGNAAFSFTAADLLANDLGTGLRITGIDTTGLEGQLTWATDGDGTITGFTYTPTPDSVPSFVWHVAERSVEDPSFIKDVDPFQALAPGETRTTSFTYTAVDAAGREVSATVDLDVAGINDQTVVLDASVRWPSLGSPGGIGGSGAVVRLVAVDLDNDVFALGIATQPAFGYLDLFPADPPQYLVDDPSDPDFGLSVDPPSTADPTILWGQPNPQDIYAEALTIEYVTFSSTFTGFDSFTYVASDDRTLTTYSPAATISIEIFEV